MKSEDDPEARIRALERPLTDQAQASELGGGGQYDTGSTYVPPPVPAYNAPDYTTPTYGSAQPYGTQPYGAQPYGAQPYGTQPYGAQPYGAPRRKVSGGIPWLVFGLIAVVLAAIAAGVIVFTTRMSGVTSPGDSSFSGDGGSIDIPSFPSIPSPEIPSIPASPGAPGADPGVITASPGEQVTVSGIDENKTIACNDASVTINGIRNTVNITGHCVKVTVSGINNIVTVDIADAVGASGFDNRVTYHSGSPQIENSGGNNVVAQG